MAKVLAVCRLGDELRSASAKQSQRFLALGIDIEHFLKIEDVFEALVCRSRDAKKFPRPQARQSAFQDEYPGVVSRWQRNS
jgi:4'-phosphopantetheinyl transferase EntD